MVNRNAGCDNLSENVKVHELSGDIFCLWMRNHFDLGENAMFNYKYKDEVAGMAELLPVKICAKLHEDCEVSYPTLAISKCFIHVISFDCSIHLIHFRKQTLN